MACHLPVIDEPSLDEKEQCDSCHIFCHETVTFCLVCKEGIVEGFVANKRVNVLNHLQSVKHLKSIRNLFKLCVPDPMSASHDMEYTNIVNNCVFDLSMLLHKESSYVCDQDGHLLCLICEQNICGSTDIVQAIKSNLVNHLQSEYHIQHVRDRVSWIYYMNNSADFLQFHKSVLYCSSCKKSLDSSENTLIQTAVYHLQIEKHIPGYGLDSAGQGTQTNDCENHKHFQELSVVINDGKIPVAQCNMLNTRENNKKSQKNVVELALKKLANKSIALLLNKNYFKEKDNNFFCEICQTSIKFTVNGSRLNAHCYSLDHNQILIENATGYILSLQQQVETVNCSVDYMPFQLALNLFTKDSILMSHLIYISYDDEQFVCLLCNEPIRFSLCGKFIKNHFFRSIHKQKAYITNQSNSLKLLHQFDSKSSENSSNLNFDNFDASCNSDIFVNYSQKHTDLFDQPGVSEVFETLLEAQPVIKKNRHFIERNEQSYFCTICKTKILFSRRLHVFMVYLNVHFNSKYHKRQIKVINSTNYLNKGILTQDFSTTGEDNSKNVSVLTNIYSNNTQNVSSKADTANIAITEEDNLLTFSTVKSRADKSIEGLLKQNEDKLTFVNTINEISNSKKFSDQLDLKSSENPCDINISSCVASCNSDLFVSDLFEKPEVKDIFEILLETQPIVKKNRHLIEKSNQNYCCTVCKTKISSSKRLHVLILYFNMHFKSKCHINKMKVIDATNPKSKIVSTQGSKVGEGNLYITSTLTVSNTSDQEQNTISMIETATDIKTTEGDNLKTLSTKLKHSDNENVECILKENEVKRCFKKLLNKHEVLVLNKKYLCMKGNKIFCEVCQFYIEINVSGSHLKAHCYSVDHNQILTDNATKYISTLRHKLDLLNASEISLEFELVLNLFTRETVRMSHLIYINYDSESFFCILCDLPIRFTPCGKHIKHHFFNPSHQQKASRANHASHLRNISQQSDLMFLDESKGTNNMLDNNSTKLDTVLNFNVVCAEEIQQVEDHVDIKEKRCTTNEVNLENTLEFQKNNVKFIELKENNVTCPDCGECVDIYNDDIEFSVQLHMHEHKDLTEINVKTDIAHAYDMDYICPICQDVIPIFNRNVDLSVNLHFTEVHYGQKDSRDNISAQCDINKRKLNISNELKSLYNMKPK